MSVVFLSFISPRSSRRYDPTDIATDRANENDLYVLKKSEGHVAGFASPIRASDERWAIEDVFDIFEVNLALLQIALTLRRVPIEPADMRELFFQGSIGHCGYLSGS
jgi:hypothetical protein